MWCKLHVLGVVLVLLGSIVWDIFERFPAQETRNGKPAKDKVWCDERSKSPLKVKMQHWHSCRQKTQHCSYSIIVYYSIIVIVYLHCVKIMSKYGWQCLYNHVLEIYCNLPLSPFYKTCALDVQPMKNWIWEKRLPSASWKIWRDPPFLVPPCASRLFFTWTIGLLQRWPLLCSICICN